MLGVEAAAGGALADLGLGRLERLAHLGRHQLGERVGLRVEQVGRGPHPPGALGVRREPVRREGRRGAGRAGPRTSAVGQRLEGLAAVSPVAGLTVAMAMGAPPGPSGWSARPEPQQALGWAHGRRQRAPRPARGRRAGGARAAEHLAHGVRRPAAGRGAGGAGGAGGGAVAERDRGAADARGTGCSWRWSATSWWGSRRARRPTTRGWTRRPCELSTLLVEPRWGRRGHGSRLVAASVDHWRGDGVTTRRHLGLGARPGDAVVPAPAPAGSPTARCAGSTPGRGCSGSCGCTPTCGRT